MNGFILYRGPSMIDGQPIICIATGLEDGGSNSKTGSMVQIYIMRADQSPLKAVQTGDDASICGTCPHRGYIITEPKTEATGDLFAGACGHRSIPILAPTLPFNIVGSIRGTVAIER